MLIMVHFNVQFEILVQSILTKKTDHGGRIVIVLMFGGFAGFGFNEESAFEPLLAGVVPRHGEKTGQMVEFPFHIRVEEGHIPFPSAPEYIILPSQFNGGIEGVLDLSARIEIGRAHV